MKLFCLLLLSFISFNAIAQSDNKIVLGTIDSINSKILNEQRKVWVYVPNSNADDIYSRHKYPVVYLLDGDAHFYSVTGMIQQLSSVNGNTICPQMIVVGIPNTNRTRDLTPTHVDADPPYMDSSSCKASGGGESFISFIEKELIPHIDSIYPTEPYRMLIGHSFGGLTVINTLVHHEKIFNSYIAIDPSMWWDHKKLLQETKTAMVKSSYPSTSLFLGIANTMDDNMDTTRVKKDTTQNTKHIRAILELNTYLGMNKQNQLKYKYKYYKDDDHSSVPLITEYDGLRFIFSKYQLKLTPEDFMNVNKQLLSKIITHYADLTKEFGFKQKPPEDLVNGLGYQAIAQKHNDVAEEFFKLNVDNYPESANVYDSLGDAFNAKGDKNKAIESYQKSLSVKEVPATREKLQKLQQK